jgi:hypothetical protein
MCQGLPPGQRVGSAGCQLARQQANGIGEQVLRDRLRREKCAQAGQLSGGWVVVG